MITDYEGIEDDDKHVAQDFVNLSINMQNDNIPKLELFYIESKQFHTFFGLLKGLKSIIVVNTLTNKVLKYQITLSDKTVLLITILALYIFNLLIHLQYNNIMVKGLLFDLRALTQSKAGNG